MLAPGPIAAFLVVAAPWYVAILLDQGRHFLDVFILDHNVQRFTSTVHNHPGPFWYYVPVLLAGLFPWSGLAVPALFRLEPRASRADLFVLLWLVPAARLLLARRLQAARLHPALRAAARDPDGPRRGPAGLGARDTRAHAVGPRRGPRRPRARRRSSPRRRPPSSASTSRCGARPSRSACGPSSWPSSSRGASARTRPGPSGCCAIGAAGLLVLLALAAPPILARRESGRRLFVPAMGRDVLAWGAWRTAWMAGYFYNDGKVRAVEQASEILAAVDEGPTLVLAGPSERRRLEAMSVLEVHTLAAGPRENALAARGKAPEHAKRARDLRERLSGDGSAFRGLSLGGTKPGMRLCRRPLAPGRTEAPRGDPGSSFHHPDDGAALRREGVGHLVHELAHEEDAAAVGLQQVLRRERVGHRRRVEALALVAHLDLERAVVDRELDVHALRLVLLVAVLDGVHDGLADRHRHVVDRFLVEAHEGAALGEDGLHHVQHLEAAGDVEGDRPVVGGLGHRGK